MKLNFLTLIVTASTLSSCAFMAPPVTRLADSKLLDNEVSTIQVASHPGKAEGGLIFRKIDGVDLNEIKAVTDKGYYYYDNFKFTSPVVVQLAPGKHNFLLQYQFISLSSITYSNYTVHAKPCLYEMSINSKPGILYVIDWQRNNVGCVNLKISKEPYTKIRAR